MKIKLSQLRALIREAAGGKPPAKGEQRASTDNRKHPWGRSREEMEDDISFGAPSREYNDLKRKLAQSNFATGWLGNPSNRISIQFIVKDGKMGYQKARNERIVLDTSPLFDNFQDMVDSLHGTRVSFADSGEPIRPGERRSEDRGEPERRAPTDRRGAPQNDDV